jgi:methylphosphotriester-DNA--protein-cysteine methyltransferase
MSDDRRTGVLYTEHASQQVRTPLLSLWSFEARARDFGRPPVRITSDGTQEYWLEHGDPLLNTMLPGTPLSIVVNLGAPWASGRSLVGSELLPRLCVVGPLTQPRILRVGRNVRAIGAVLPPVLARAAFAVDAEALVDQVVPLDCLWAAPDVRRLEDGVAGAVSGQARTRLRDELLSRIRGDASAATWGGQVSQLITQRKGRVSVDALAAAHDLSRQHFTRRFRAATGLSPKQFATISRFQALVQTMLVTNVEEWASLATSAGFYDQAHMINEFRALAGSPPTTFFQPLGRSVGSL